MSRFLDDAALISALKGNRIEMFEATSWIMNESGWDEIVSIYIRKFQMSLDLKEEVFQEGITAFVINIRKNTFEHKSKLRTYFDGICKRMLMTRLTNKIRDSRRYVLMESAKIIQLEKVSEAYIQESNRQIEIGETLDRMIAQLGIKCQQVLAYIKLGYPMKEIATILGKQYQTIKNSGKDCRKELRIMAEGNPILMKEIKNLI